MPRHDQHCTVCVWKSEITVQAGENPPCPECGAPTQRLWSSSNIQRDEIPGGVLCENYSRDPIRFYSHSERRAYMKQHGLRERETFAPMPGTDKDPQGIPNPKGYVDPYTREAAIALILRQQGASSDGALDPVAQSRTYSGDVPNDATLSDVLEMLK